MAHPSRRGFYSIAAVVLLVGIAVAARQLADAGLSAVSLRVAMFAFTLLCPMLLGLAIGVWGGIRGGAWGGRGVATTYAGVVGWAWVEDGSFPVGFQLDGFETPLFVTLINVGIFLMTLYFMLALGRSGGRLAAHLLDGRPSPATPAAVLEHHTDHETRPVPGLGSAERRAST